MARTMRVTILLCAVALCCASERGPCAVRYVSREGGDVPPFTSPQTAARSVADALEVAEGL